MVRINMGCQVKMNSRILTFYNEALSMYCGEVISSPRMAIIYPVYGCNFNCRGCLCSDYNQEKIYMDYEKFKTLALQLKAQGVRSVEFCGGGEPLLHPRVNEMISWITNRLHLDFGVMTNGSLLTDELSYTILTRAKYIRISLYVNSYQAVIKKVKKLIELKKELGSETIIGAKFLIDGDTKEQVVEMIKNCKEVGVDHISVKALRGENEEIVDLQDTEDEINSLGIENLSCNLKKTKLTEPCWLSPIHTLIDPLGDVYICCYYMDRKEDHCIGNVFEKPFSEIWGSSTHCKKISCIDMDKCNVYDCRWHTYNSELKELFQNNKMQHEFC